MDWAVWVAGEVWAVWVAGEEPLEPQGLGVPAELAVPVGSAERRGPLVWRVRWPRRVSVMLFILYS